MEFFRCLGWLVVVVVVVSLFSVAEAAMDPYSEALLSLKSELIDSYGSLSDWRVPSGENTSVVVRACSWSGVTCDKNSTFVIGLDLSKKKLGGVIAGENLGLLGELIDLNLSHNSFSGELPVNIFTLTNLRILDISRNNFSGHFPGGISSLENLVVLDAFSNSFSGPLPAEVSKLEKLKFLNLAGSYFNGSIPSEYGSFKSLEFLHLAGNFLTGNLPADMGKLKTMTHLEIGYNAYQGNIPWEFGNMSELQYLDIAGAKLSGSIPKELSNLTKLASLFLFRNQLTGFIPWELSRITTLTSLDLSDNQISGPIPASFSELKNLRLLSLMYNQMSGNVSEKIAELPLMETLLIWNNFFSGSLPQNLGRNRKLKWVDVSTNNFSGEIPPDICSGGVLYKLILFSNKFSGGLSPSLSNCSSLVRLRLEDNLFSGNISLKFSYLPDITYVDLSRNKFRGGIPTDMAQASKFQYFNVSNNPELGAEIPQDIWSMPFLLNFSASSCGISGSLPFFQSCKSISVVELANNNLSGIVPASISECHDLTRIDLANNNLSGHIPEELANLPYLAVLDLSRNSFTGKIPINLSYSSSLSLLNVSFNDLSGSIPSQHLFQSMDRSAFVGNSKLCGAPLQPCSQSMAILGTKGMGKLAMILVLSAGLSIFVGIAVMGMFYFRKGSKGQWKMVSFTGLPLFTANDVLRSFSSENSKNAAPALSSSIGKAVLPTGITVSVKKIEWKTKRIRVMSEFITQLGNVRHQNLVRLLGFCHNKQIAYLLFDYLPNETLAEKIITNMEWLEKAKIVMGIAKGLRFLHHECYPAIPHGDLNSSTIVFDEIMESHLTEFGLKYLMQLNGSSLPTSSRRETGEFKNATKGELCRDVYNFGEIILEILTNGRLINAGTSIQNRLREDILREILDENKINSINSQEEVKLVLEVAILCTKSRPSERPSMEDVLKLLSGMERLSK